MTRAATALLCAALAAAAPRAARASAADAFENKVKPVSGQLYTKAGKIELTVPSLGLSLNDAFFSKYVAGVKLAYHFNEYLSLGATGIYAMKTSPTGSTNVCRANLGCVPATTAQLDQVPGQIKWMGGLELAFSPVYGKVNVFAAKAVHFDLSLFAGPDLVSFKDVIRRDAAGAPLSTVSPGDATSAGFHAGIGSRIFLARSVALRLELRDVFYWVPHLGRDTFQSQLLAELGLSFLLGGRSDAP